MVGVGTQTWRETGVPRGPGETVTRHSKCPATSERSAAACTSEGVDDIHTRRGATIGARGPGR
jgi:hypothetical protein